MRDAKEKRIKTTIYLRPEVHKYLKLTAAQQSISVSEFINRFFLDIADQEVKKT
jgi:predicted HicB family RNase H-like nuclease